MAKKRAKKKAAARKRTTKTAKRPSRKSAKRPARRASLAKAIGAAADDEKGACLVPNPAGGASMCIVTTRAKCTAMKGKFVGGSC